MGSKANASLAVFIMANLAFFNLVSAARCGLRRPCPKSNTKTNVQLAAAEHPSPLQNQNDQHFNEGTCNKNAWTFSACGALLGGLLNFTTGVPPSTPCCSIMDGMVDFEAASCLCFAFKDNVMGFEIPEIPICLDLIFNACKRTVPIGFSCSD